MKVELAVTVLRAYGRPEAMAIADLLDAQREVIEAWRKWWNDPLGNGRDPIREALARLAELEGK